MARDLLNTSHGFNGLFVTDVWPASGEQYLETRTHLLDRGAHIHQLPVNVFDYRFTMVKDVDVPQPDQIDLIVGFGMNFLCFGDHGMCSGSSTQRQYDHLAAGKKQFMHFNHQQIFNEALLGQSLRTTQILIHQDNHAFISPILTDVACARVPLYNPPGEDLHASLQL